MVHEHYQMCNFCVMDTSDPDIIFNEDGICNHCISAKKSLAALGSKQHRVDNIEKQIDKIKKRNANKPYDVIMGVSGGVDSSYALIRAKELGLRILAVHCDTGWNSEIAVANIKNLIDKLSIDLETVVVDWVSIRGLQRSFFKASVSNCDIPQDHAIVAVSNQISSKLGIKDFISGGNLSGESVMPASWVYDARDLKHLKAINKAYDKVSLKNYPKLSAFMSYFYLPFVKGVRNYRLLNDLDYNPIEAKKILIESYGWKDYGGKHHESVFTRFYQAYYLPQKFGFDKRRGHLSSLIASNCIDREVALEALKVDLYVPEKLKEDKKYFLKKMGFNEKEWKEIMDTLPVSHYSFPTNRKLHSFITIIKIKLESKNIKIRRSW